MSLKSAKMARKTKILTNLALKYVGLVNALDKAERKEKNKI